MPQITNAAQTEAQQGDEKLQKINDQFHWRGPPLLCLIFFVQQMDTKTQDRHAYAENKSEQSDHDISRCGAAA